MRDKKKEIDFKVITKGSFSFFIRAGNYLLRPIRTNDLEWARLLHNDPSVLNMLTDPTVITPKMQKLWYHSLLKSKKSKRLVVLFHGVRMGVVRLDEIDFNNKSICIGLDIEKSYRQQGHGRKIYEIFLDFCFNKLRMNRCWLFVAAYNERAHELYEKLGFKEEGRAREAIYRFEKFNDYILMSILRKEYFDIKYD